jgi:hypothetical protein
MSTALANIAPTADSPYPFNERSRPGALLEVRFAWVQCAMADGERASLPTVTLRHLDDKTEGVAFLSDEENRAKELALWLASKYRLDRVFSRDCMLYRARAKPGARPPGRLQETVRALIDGAVVGPDGFTVRAHTGPICRALVAEGRVMGLRTETTSAPGDAFDVAFFP